MIVLGDDAHSEWDQNFKEGGGGAGKAGGGGKGSGLVGTVRLIELRQGSNPYMNCELCHTQYVRGILTTTKRTIHHLTIVFDKGCPKKNLAVF